MATFDVRSDDQRRFNSYAPASFPDTRDNELAAYVRQVMAAGADAVASACALSSDNGRRVVCAYAERACSLAVRSKDREHLVEALVALAVGGLGQNDLGALMRMALIEDAAERLEIDLPTLFEEASRLVGHPSTAALMVWLTRAPEDRTLRSMGYEAHTGPSGFRYRWAS